MSIVFLLVCVVYFVVFYVFFFFLMIRLPPRSTPLYSSAASDVYKRQAYLSGNFLNFLSQDWIMLKISIVFGLIWYQLFCYQIINKLECNSLEWSSFKMRLFNELPVLFLIIGIFAAVYKF